MWTSEFDFKHQNKSVGHIGRNVVIIIIKMRAIVRIFKVIIIIKLYLRNLGKWYLSISQRDWKDEMYLFNCFHLNRIKVISVFSLIFIRFRTSLGLTQRQEARKNRGSYTAVTKKNKKNKMLDPVGIPYFSGASGTKC